MISQPMNLKEVKAKLHDGFYKNKDEVKRDLYLIASNAKAFNQPGEPVWQLADTYEKNLTTMWQTADKTLENKQGKKETPTDVKPEATAPTLKFKVNTALATPAVSVEKGNQRLTNTAVPPHDLAKTEAPRSKNTRRKRDAPDALDDELLGLTEESPRPVITPLAPEPKLKKVKLAFNQPALSSDASERPPGVKNSGRPIHALPSKPVSNSVSSTLAPGAGSPAVSQFLERKVKLSTSQRPSSVPSGTHTPHAPTPPPPTVSVPPTTSPVPPAGSNALVSALWRELPGVHLPIRKLRVQKYLHDITKEPIFAPFKVPVTEDIAPGYRKIITSPMDVTKMLRKLEKGEYRTMGDVAKDVEQIIWKYVTQVFAEYADSFPDREWATPFERKALDTWPRLVDTRLITDEKRLIITWMERTAKSDNGIWFARPGMVDALTRRTIRTLADHHTEPLIVDPVADGVPDYYEFVKKEDARDLRTIRETLQRTKDNSITLESLDADIYLMIENAQKYNPPGSVVYNAATEVGKRWDQMRLDIEPGRRGRFLGTNEGRR
ncbi:hypothetical protein QFC19_004745 [Naganishia cerealis]|uniref:Uncharacterized protein n=1 Tax=Naganishia cerealis TaxID=610337 RepID=A0ACC2VU32_9TREE|nr:hypothetical protein QFC19_004745 [Naganishia cerealis]